MAKNNFNNLYGRELTQDEYREIGSNLSGFFKTVMAWEKSAQGENK